MNIVPTLAYRLLCVCFALVTNFFSLYAQTDSIVYMGASSNGNLLRLDANGSLLLRGAYDGSFVTPAAGPGTRFMWIPNKAAIRAGNVTGLQWDDANIGDFSVAMGEDCRASANGAVALGFRNVAAQQSAFATGEQSTASGAASVAMGYHAHTNARQGSFVFADRSTVDTLRAGVNHSANWRVAGGFRIFTSSNLSTGLTIQSGASVSNWGQSNAVISTSTGALLTTAGVWTNSSDVNRKYAFEDISGEELLIKLRNVPIQEWSYKSDNNNLRHIGPMAQDFRKAFGLGNDDVTIGTIDADGVALACIQALESRTISQKTEIEKLKLQNEQLLQRIVALEETKK